MDKSEISFFGNILEKFHQFLWIFFQLNHIFHRKILSVVQTRSVNLLYWFLNCKNANIVSDFCGNNLTAYVLLFLNNFLMEACGAVW